MHSTLQEAIAGARVLVKLGAQEYPLAFPIQAVILYKKETAALDRQRAADRRQQGLAKLTRDELRELRRKRQTLLTEAEKLRPAKGQPWDAEKYAQFDSLLEEATLVKCAVDEEAGTGDSLYDLYNWRKISPEGDPERMLLALWVGLHKFAENASSSSLLARSQKPEAGLIYQPQLSREEIGLNIHPGNASAVTLAISKALAAHIVAPPEVEEFAAEERTTEIPDPNASGPEIPAPLRQSELGPGDLERHQPMPWPTKS